MDEHSTLLVAFSMWHMSFGLSYTIYVKVFECIKFCRFLNNKILWVINFDGVLSYNCFVNAYTR